jgi:phosphoribosylcarboxyaminoimidazole (NCAIR) mutase
MPLRGTYTNQLNEPFVGPVTNNTFTGPQNLIKTAAAYSAKPCIIPAYYLETGSAFRVEAYGTFSTTGTPTLVFGLYWGSTVLGVNVALTTASGAATLPWHLETVTFARSTVVSTAVPMVTKGYLKYGTTVSAVTEIPIPGIALAAVNVDNSAAAELSVQATFGTSSASNIVVLHGLYMSEITQS